MAIIPNLCINLDQSIDWKEFRQIKDFQMNSSCSNCYGMFLNYMFTIFMMWTSLIIRLFCWYDVIHLNGLLYTLLDEICTSNCSWFFESSLRWLISYLVINTRSIVLYAFTSRLWVATRWGMKGKILFFCFCFSTFHYVYEN